MQKQKGDKAISTTPKETGKLLKKIGYTIIFKGENHTIPRNSQTKKVTVASKTQKKLGKDQKEQSSKRAELK